MNRALPLLVLFTSLLLSSVGYTKTHRFAVIVGNNLGDSTTTPLRHAQRDATRIGEILQEIAEFPAGNIEMRLGRNAAEIREALAHTTARIQAVRAESDDQVIFLFYYSGHGEPGHFATGDSEFPVVELKEYLRTSPADMRIGIIDACHSGSIVRAKGGNRASIPLALDDQLTSEGYAILTSSAPGESSHESDEIRGSFFTHALVSGLRGDADYSGDDRVTLSELYRYTYFTTLERSQLTGLGAQHPHFESAQHGELVLTRLEDAAALLTFPAASEGQFVVFHGASDSVVAEVHKEAGEPRTIAVRPGQLQVYRQGKDTRRVDIRVHPQREVILDTESMNVVEHVAYATRGPATTVSLAAHGGYQWFHDSAFTSAYVKNLPILGLETRVHNLGMNRLDLAIDALIALADQEITTGEGTTGQHLLNVNIGLAALYRMESGPFAWSLGPRLAWVLFRRSLDDKAVPAEERVQLYSAASPGILMELSGRILPRVTLALSARVGYLHFEADDIVHDLVTTEAALTTSFLF